MLYVVKFCDVKLIISYNNVLTKIR